MTLRAAKTYSNGCTQTAYVNDRDIDAHVASVDAEDNEAGLIGSWEIEAWRVDGRRV